MVQPTKVEMEKCFAQAQMPVCMCPQCRRLLSLSLHLPLELLARGQVELNLYISVCLVQGTPPKKNNNNNMKHGGCPPDFRLRPPKQGRPWKWTVESLPQGFHLPSPSIGGNQLQRKTGHKFRV